VARIRTQLQIKKAMQYETEANTNLRLLKQMLPENVIQRLKSGQRVVADSYEDLTFVFVDIVSFTSIASSLPAAEVVLLLNELYAAFDAVIGAFSNLMRIESRGDSYVIGTLAPYCACRFSAHERKRMKMTKTIFVAMGDHTIQYSDRH